MKLRSDILFAWALTALMALLILGLERAATERTPRAVKIVRTVEHPANQVKQDGPLDGGNLPDIFLGK